MTKQITKEKQEKIFALESKFIEATKNDEYEKVINLVNDGLKTEGTMKSCLWNPISPLMQAVNQNAIQIAYILLCNGASPIYECAGKSAIDVAESSKRKTMYELLFSVDLADKAAHAAKKFDREEFLKKLPKKHDIIFEVIKSRMEGWMKHYSMNKHLSNNFEIIKDEMTKLVAEGIYSETINLESRTSKEFPIYQIDQKYIEELKSLEQLLSLSGDVKYCVEAH